MKSKIRYIILVSDDSESTAILMEMIKDVTSTMKTDIAKNFKQLSLFISKKLPGLIVMHFKKSERGYAGFLSKIRKNKKMDKVPVLLYPTLPVKKDFQGLLVQLGKP